MNKQVSGISINRDDFGGLETTRVAA